MKKLLLALSVVALCSGCANMSVENTDLSKFTHVDLQNAQKLAKTPQRSAVWKAVEAQVSAGEALGNAVAAQTKACVESLKVTKPDGTVGVATLIELGVTTIAQVDANCKPIPIK